MGRAGALAATGMLGLVALGVFGPASVGAANSAIASWNGALQRNAAAAALVAAQDDAQRRHARLALRAMPYDQNALTLATMGSGTGQSRLAALNLSAALGWRDPVTNARLIEAALAENRVEDAALRVEAIARNGNAAAAAPFADRLLARKGGPQALANRAAYRTSNVWWTQYLSSEPTDGAAVAGRIALLRRLDPADPTFLREALLASSPVLKRAGRADAAVEIWRERLATRRDFDGLVYDPQFAEVAFGRQAIGQEWEVPTGRARIESAPSGGLAIELRAGTRGQLLSQRIDPSPGTLALTVEGDVGREQGERFGWQIACDATGVLPLEPDGGRGLVGTWSVRIPEGCGGGYVSLAAFQGSGTAKATVRNVRLVSAQ